MTPMGMMQAKQINEHGRNQQNAIACVDDNGMDAHGYLASVYEHNAIRQLRGCEHRVVWGLLTRAVCPCHATAIAHTDALRLCFAGYSGRLGIPYALVQAQSEEVAGCTNLASMQNAMNQLFPAERYFTEDQTTPNESRHGTQPAQSSTGEVKPRHCGRLKTVLRDRGESS